MEMTTQISDCSRRLSAYRSLSYNYFLHDEIVPPGGRDKTHKTQEMNEIGKDQKVNEA